MRPLQDQPDVKDRFVRQCGASSVLCPGEYAGPVLDTSSVLSDVVDAITDWDVACLRQARALSFKIPAGYGLKLTVCYRTPVRSTWQFGSRLCHQFEDRTLALAGALHTGNTNVVPCGPLGIIEVRLKPEAATRLVGARPSYFLGARVGLDDLFGTRRVAGGEAYRGEYQR